MKKLIILLVLAVTFPVAFTSCSTPPDQRVAEVQTLRAVGTSAKSAMDAATGLLKSGQITVAQWQKVADAYDNKFQPAYKLAVASVQANLDSISSPDIAALAAQVVQLVATYTAKTP